MTVERDPQIARLLLDEIERHLGGLASGAETQAARRSLHSLKGSASLAGERSFSESLARLERRLIAGDASALDEARGRVEGARDALAVGAPIPGAVWPEAPDDLRVGREARDERYVAEMQDRLARIDDALAGGEDLLAAAAAFREVHAMKGAALAVMDELVAWFCHGLEERLRGGEKSEEAARRALADLARFRGVLGEMIASPERALESLRGRSRVITPPPPALGETSEPRPTSEAPPELIDETIRVPTATLDRLAERARQVGYARGAVSDGAVVIDKIADRAQKVRLALNEALRLIGPPKPWGAPAAAIRRISDASNELARLGDRLDVEAATLKESADRIRVDAAASQGDLTAIRTTTVAWLFERVRGAVVAEARRTGREVRLVLSGGEAAIDRRSAEALYDPVLQLARNAVAHGIETASERALRGKHRVGTVRLRAERRSGGLRLVVQDDGAGVDVADVRLRAVSRGLVSAEMARVADDATLLGLLFVPGFTTRDSADLLAGRGVGLDVALDAVQRLGGTIRLTSARGAGVTAIVDVPVEPGLIRVLWVEIDGASFAIPAPQARRVILASDAPRPVFPLAKCLGRKAATSSAPALAIELDTERRESECFVGVDRLGVVEEVTLRRVAPLITTAGPYAGAIVRGSELHLCLDAHALAEICAGFTG